MTETYTAEWYDVAMTEPEAPAMLSLEESPWLSLYEALAEMIEPHEEVVDLGCGTGRFIELLRRNGHYAQITGVDWSVAALEEAFRYVGVNGGVRAPTFQRTDLTEWQPEAERGGNTVYVCTEVLEHLEDDRGLVRRIPPGHRLLFSVPNFDSESHLRTFRNVGDIWDRYATLLRFIFWRLLGEERKGIHVCETIRRADSW